MGAAFSPSDMLDAAGALDAAYVHAVADADTRLELEISSVRDAFCDKIRISYLSLSPVARQTGRELSQKTLSLSFCERTFVSTAALYY